jgi:hypothetical protein
VTVAATTWQKPRACRRFAQRWRESRRCMRARLLPGQCVCGESATEAASQVHQPLFARVVKLALQPLALLLSCVDYPSARPPLVFEPSSQLGLRSPVLTAMLAAAVTALSSSSSSCNDGSCSSGRQFALPLDQRRRTPTAKDGRLRVRSVGTSALRARAATRCRSKAGRACRRCSRRISRLRGS